MLILAALAAVNSLVVSMANSPRLTVWFPILDRFWRPRYATSLPPHLQRALWRVDRQCTARARAWSKREKRRQGWRAGLRLLSRINDHRFTIASRHWPHLLCWSWLLEWHRHRVGYDGRRRLFGFRYSRVAGQVSCKLLWLGRVHFSWQTYPPTPSYVDGMEPHPGIDWTARHQFLALLRSDELVMQ